MPWNKDGSRKAFYKKSYKKSGFKMKKPSSFKLNNDKDKPSHDEEKYPTEKYTGSKYTVGVVQFSGGLSKGGKTLADTFTKVAQNRAKMSKTIQKLLEKKGYTFK